MNSITAHNLQPLDHRFSDVDWYPAIYSSTTMHYSIVLKVPEPEPTFIWSVAVSSFSYKVIAATEFLCKGKTEIQTKPCDRIPERMTVDSLTVHVELLDDLHELYKYFYPLVKNISGPLTPEHCEYLCQPIYSVHYKNEPYYGRYSCRLTTKVNYSVSSTVEVKNLLTDAAEVIAHNVSKFRQHRGQVGYFDREYSFYMDINDAVEILPILILGSGTSITYYVTVCMPKIPAQRPIQAELFPDK